MKTIAALFRIALFVSVASATPAVSRGDEKSSTERISLSTEEIEQMLVNAKKYEFVLADDACVVTSTGEKIREKDLLRFLRKSKADKTAFFVIRVDPRKHEVDRATKLANVFVRFGAEKVVVRAIDGKAGGSPDATVAANSKDPAAASGQKTLLIRGEPNPESTTEKDRRPNLNGRPERLRPEPLPPRVRYVFKSDADVLRADERISQRLLAAEVTGDAALFGDTVLVQPGAWFWLKNTPGIGKSDAIPMSGIVPGAKKNKALDGCVLRNAAEIALLEKALRERIASDGGGVVRALRAREMDRWWTFIGFDIEEPTLVVESKGGKYRFILGFSSDQVLLIDELDALSDSL